MLRMPLYLSCANLYTAIPVNNLDYVSVATEIAQEAGALLERYFERQPPIEYKREFDLVTAADRASEKLVVERLRSRFPTHGIVAEEGSEVNAASEYIWYVDPLDGTTNFAHSFPMFNVSLGLTQKGQPVAGVVYDPIRKEFFTAEKGSGAFLNNRKIRVSQAEALKEGLFATGFPSPKRPQLSANVYFFHQISMLTHGARRAGSAALDLCYVACGRFDGFWEFGLKPWDAAAGVLMVSEAGGTYTDMQGGPYAPGGPHLAATNGLLHEELLELFDDVFRGKLRVPLEPPPT